MSLQRYLPLLLFLQVALFAQTKLETEIEKIKDIPGITLEYLEGDRLSVNYDGVKTKIFYIGDKKPPKTTHKDVPSFVFDISELDTSLFNYKYYFWQEVPVSFSFPKPFLGDLNKNGYSEMYGWKKDYFTEKSEVWCYEQDRTGIFKPVFKYNENTVTPYNIYDINGDGNLELHLIATHFDSVWGGYIHDQTFFKKTSDDSFATQFYFDYNISTGTGLNIQLNDFTYGDFDNDGTKDAIYHNLLVDVQLVKFNKTDLTFDSVYSYSTFIDSSYGNEFVAGFTVGDFDLDGMTEVLFSSEYGNIYVLENESEGRYSINWDGNSGVWNSYINFKTMDLDGNGKEEFWVGGESFEEGATRLVCFETNGNNSFYPVAEIAFPGLLTLNNFSGLNIDVDDDGKEELLINVGNKVVIIKFTGSSNRHNYKINYYNEFDNNIESSIMYKFPNDRYPSIILCLYQSQNGLTRNFTQIFKNHLVTNVKEELKILSSYELFNSYPNPFNPSTNITFIIFHESEVMIKVYNSIGEEIITLLNNTLRKGEHKIVWNGRDKNGNVVPSGIYFISLIATNRQGGEIRKTIKTILLK